MNRHHDPEDQQHPSADDEVADLDTDADAVGGALEGYVKIEGETQSALSTDTSTSG